MFLQKQRDKNFRLIDAALSKASRVVTSCLSNQLSAMMSPETLCFSMRGDGSSAPLLLLEVKLSDDRLSLQCS